MKELICITCPKGCRLKAEQTASGWEITGHSCPRGLQYGLDELTHPTRVITSTVRISGGMHPRLPVKTSAPIPKELIPAAMALLEDVELTAPIRCGQVVVADIGGTGIDFIATRDM